MCVCVHVAGSLTGVGVYYCVSSALLCATRIYSIFFYSFDRYSHGDVGISAEIAPSNSLPPMKCDHLSTSDVKTTTRPTMNVANSSRLGNLEDWVNAPEFVPTNTKRSGDITDSNHTPTAIHETSEALQFCLVFQEHHLHIFLLSI